MKLLVITGIKVKISRQPVIHNVISNYFINQKYNLKI